MIGLRVAATLNREYGIDQVLAPERTASGSLSVDIVRYRVALFPFLDGASGHEKRFADEELAATARLVAAVHGSTDRLRMLPLPRIRFEDEFAEQITRSLRAVSALQPGAGDYRRRVQGLLLAEQGEVLSELDTVRRLGAEAARLTTDPVLTHGDPNYANLVRDAGGRIHLVDWSEPALGSRERDLFAFVEDRFELSLRHYLDITGPVPLHAPAFAYYAHLWVVQEIADYSTRILLTNTDRAEDEHAWECLTPYLPIPHADLHAGIEEIEAVLRGVR